MRGESGDKSRECWSWGRCHPCGAPLAASPSQPCVSEPQGNTESVIRGWPHVHGVPVAQPAAVPAAPGEHLASGGQGQVVVAVGMGSNLHDVSGGETLDQLGGLTGKHRKNVTSEQSQERSSTAPLGPLPSLPTPTPGRTRPPRAPGGTRLPEQRSLSRGGEHPPWTGTCSSRPVLAPRPDALLGSCLAPV